MYINRLLGLLSAEISWSLNLKVKEPLKTTKCKKRIYVAMNKKEVDIQNVRKNKIVNKAFSNNF